MQKADYGKIAGGYDKGRFLDDAVMETWLNAVTRHSPQKTDVKLLDIGCGTGRFAIPFAVKSGYQVTGADASAEMLAQARAKDTDKKIAWDIQDAQALTYPGDSFDIVFMSQVIHHCPEPAKAASEAYRVLKPGGVIMLRGCIIEEIRGDPEATFFPETIPINEARIMTMEQTVALLEGAGFTGIKSELVHQTTCRNGQEFYERMAAKNVSGLAMIPEEAFIKGLERLRAYVREHPDDPWLTNDPIRLTTGIKGE